MRGVWSLRGLGGWLSRVQALGGCGGAQVWPNAKGRKVWSGIGALQGVLVWWRAARFDTGDGPSGSEQTEEGTSQEDRKSARRQGWSQDQCKDRV